MKAEELYHYIAHKLSNKQWGSESVSVDLNYGCFVKFFQVSFNKSKWDQLIKMNFQMPHHLEECPLALLSCCFSDMGCLFVEYKSFVTILKSAFMSL